jgi:hypothetical protein
MGIQMTETSNMTFKQRISLSGGPIDEAEGEGWPPGEERAFPCPANPVIELGYRRIPPDEMTDEDPRQAVYVGRRRIGEADWR